MIRSQWQITTAEWPTKVLSRANRIISMHLAGRGVRCYCSGTIKLAQPMRSLFRDLKGILCFILLPQNRIKKKGKNKTRAPRVKLSWSSCGHCKYPLQRRFWKALCRAERSRCCRVTPGTRLCRSSQRGQERVCLQCIRSIPREPGEGEPSCKHRTFPSLW